ncbi:MAG TPA: glycosyl hydrolase family 79 C-terminal domain-containing protein [Candidatus Sulfotelmatobacter sp.]|nr:glycosyl hydrolase family 79 C-terminal domain-containing protein [Candidatus Sulfotelmatobacter sp.]
MRRREFVQHAALAFGTAIARPDLFARGWTGNPRQVRLTLDRETVIADIPPDFIGLGYEISSVARAGLLSRKNDTYVRLVRTLGTHGVIRVGGNTADYASYVSSAPARSSPETGPGSVVNDAVLRDLGTFLDATEWKLIWGLNLGRGTKEQAVEEAKAVAAAAGSHLLAFEIGNEPDLFSHRETHRKQNYGYDAYLSEYRSFKDALRRALPGTPLAGPDVAIATDWIAKFAADEGKDLKLLTHHYYREGQNPTSTIEKLLAPDPKMEPMLTALSKASKSCGVPYRICETNSFSGGGRPGVSDRFDSALWVLDFMYELASARCAGVNMETGVNQLGFVSSYSPIGDDGKGSYSATPEFYGMLGFASGGNGELVASKLEASDLNLKAYATRQDQQRVSVTLINKERSVDCQITLDGIGPLHCESVLRLSAPSLDAANGVEFGGTKVNRDGSWHPSSMEKLSTGQGMINVHLPASSAVVLKLRS